jgi:hypothetical protein
LLAIDNAFHPLLTVDDERAEVILIVMLDGGPGITGGVNVEKCRGQVGDELVDVVLLPTVFPLEVIDCVFPFVKYVENVMIVGVDLVVVFAHGLSLKLTGERLVQQRFFQLIPLVHD